MKNLEDITKHFIQSFASANYSLMQNCLAPDLTSYITNAEGGVNLLKGCNAFIDNIKALEIEIVKPNISITQLLKVNDSQVMVMVEIKAQRKGKSLHNFAAFLLNFVDDKINEFRMVEALPADSDAFWKS